VVAVFAKEMLQLAIWPVAELEIDEVHAESIRDVP
jgi:hypothetical protein